MGQESIRQHICRQPLLSYTIWLTAQYLTRQCSGVLSRSNNPDSVDDDRRDPRRVLMRVIERGPFSDLLWIKNGDVGAVALAQETTVHQSEGCG